MQSRNYFLINDLLLRSMNQSIEIGDICLFKGKFCKVLEIDRNLGYSICTVELQDKSRKIAFTYHLDKQDLYHTLLTSQSMAETVDIGEGPIPAAEAETVDIGEGPIPACEAVGTNNQPGNIFMEIDDDTLSEFMSKQENEATKKKTATHIKILKSYLSTQDELRDIESIPATELNKLLAKYIVSVRQKYGKEYEPSYLRGMMNSFDRHLRNKNYQYSINNSPEFATARKALQSKQVQLKKMGKGNLPKRADSLTDDEIDQLYGVRQLGKQNPASVLNTLWLNNTVHFGLRSVTEHHAITWGDVSLHTDAETGAQWLEYNERQTKTRTGENPRDIRKVKPKMWATPENPDKCPVEIYKLYQAKRPDAYNAPDDPFYVSPVTKEKNPGSNDKWFKCQAVGINKIGSLMKNMAVHIPSSTGKRLTNHSARKHLVQKLTNSNVPPTHIMQITGHKNVQSVNNYSTISETQHQQISAILSSKQEYQISQYNPAHHALPTPHSLPPLQPGASIHQQNVTSIPFHQNIGSRLGGLLYGNTFTAPVNINFMSSETSVSSNMPAGNAAN